MPPCSAASKAVHFAGLEPGRTKLAARVEFDDVPKVTARRRDIARDKPPKDAVKLFAQVDARLADDNATGRIFVADDAGQPTTELLAFPGRNRPKSPSFGPFTQDGTLDGLLIAIGGKDETVPLRLQNDETIYTNCDTTRTSARDLAKHLFEPIRICGTGRWTREEDGTWTLIRFRVRRFDILGNNSLRDTVTNLRAVKGAQWQAMGNPLAELAAIRNDDDELHCMVVFDASILLFVLNDSTPSSVPRAKERARPPQSRTPDKACHTSNAGSPCRYPARPPDQIRRARLQARNESGHHPFTVTAAEFDALSAYFEPPTDAEGFDMVLHRIS